MSFHESAQNIRMYDGHRLVAELQTAEGGWVHAEIDLDEILGNENGTYLSISFVVAEATSFSIEGGSSVPILRAGLCNEAGDWNLANVNLSERIGNDNGSFVFV
ncbi:Cyanovirin-N [Aspergillus keveii]|uniref:Cyanovirin-N n=1 Tax=Aspergillus keveii TaxID=714993 RepID=A0ABR4FUL3_9EURO